MKTYAVGDYSVEVSKTWKGWEWQVHKAGKQLQSGNASSRPDGEMRAATWIDAQQPKPKTESALAAFSSAVPVGITVSEGVAVVSHFPEPADTVDFDAPALPSDRTKIKDEFPHAEHLIAAGFTTFGKVRRATDDELLAIEHVGPAALTKIREAQ